MVDKVLQPPWAGDEDVYAPTQFSYLVAIADPAVDNPYTGRTAEGAEFSVDLVGQFSGGGEDESSRLLGFCLAEISDDRDAEGARPSVTVAVWISKGSVIPRRSRAAQMDCETPRWAKVGGIVLLARALAGILSVRRALARATG